MLKKDKDGNFVHDHIDGADVSDVVSKLEESLQHFLDLHVRFIQFRVALEDADKEKKLLNDEEVYVDKVMETYCSAIASHKSYKKEIKLFEAEDAQEALKIVLNVAKSAASEVISSEDIKIKKTAPSVKKKLDETFESFVAKALKLKAAAKERGEDEEKYKAACDYAQKVWKLASSLSS